MTNIRRGLVLLFFVFCALSDVQARPNQTTKLTEALDASGIDADAYSPEMSGNGKYVIYRSAATNIVAGDTLGNIDVFLKNLVSGETSRVSVSNTNQEANNYSYPSAISKTGRYILIGSDASNLVANDNNAARDAFLIDRVLGGIQRVSLGNDGSEASGTNNAYDVSDNGRYVLFGSSDATLTSDDNNAFQDVFLRDLKLGTTELISKERPGIATDSCYSSNPAISKRARFIMFICEHSAGMIDEASIFRYDRKNQTTLLVSVDNNGNQLVGTVDPFAMSANGRLIVFTTNDQLVPEDTNSLMDVYVRDVKKGTTKLAVTGLSNALPNADVRFYSMTPDARYLAIVSAASNLDNLGNAGAITHVYRYDRKRRKAKRLSVNASNESGNADSYSAKISVAGNRVVFDSVASNLVEDDNNNYSDIFLRTIRVPRP